MKLIYLFFIISILSFSKNEVTINYKENQPLLGDGFYLKVGKIPIPTYENTIGYFSTVNIIGQNLEIKENLEKISLKVNNKLIAETKLEWIQQQFTIKDIDLKGLIINLKWDYLKKDQIELMLQKWNLEKNNYKLTIEYHYNENIEIMELNINMPKFNPLIYLDLNLNLPILKKQEYGNNQIILKKIRLNDYNMKIMENLDSPEGFKVKLNKELSIGDEEYLGIIELTPLIEKYPGVYLKESNTDDIFKNSKEIFIGANLPKDLNFNKNYKIFGNLLELNYGKYKKEVLEKTFLLDGKKIIKRVIALNNNFDKKIYLDDSEIGYSLLEKIGNMNKFYKNLKLKINSEEILIDQYGYSDTIDTSLGKLSVELGKITLFLEKEIPIIQGEELRLEILSLKNELLEEITLQTYISYYSMDNNS